MTKATILIVEDEALIAQEIKNKLTRFDYTIPEIISTGADAIEIVTKIKPNLILMDIKLKGDIDGVTAATEIQKQFDIPIIYLTTYADEATLQRAKIAEPFGYLIKPFAERELLTTIEMALYRHQLKKQLRESEAGYRSLFNGVPIGLYRSTPEGKLLDANEALLQIFGYPDKESFLNVNVIDGYAHKEDRAKWQQTIESRGEIFGFEFEARRQDGTPIWLRESAHTVRNEAGQVLYYEGAIEDITEQKQAKAALQETSQSAADIVQSIPSGLFIYQYESPDKLWLIDANPAAERLTGVTASQYQGQEFNQIWPKAYDTGITDAYLNVIKTGQPFEAEDLHYTDDRIDGAFRIRAFAMPGQRLAVAFENVTEQKQAEIALQDNVHELKIAYQQAIIYAQELTGEITDRRQAEEKVRKLNEELEQRVIDRTRDLSLLYEVTLVASESLDLTTTLERCLERLLSVSKRNVGCIHLFDLQAQTAKLMVQKGIASKELAQIETIPLDNQLIEWMVKENESILIPDIAAEPRIPTTGRMPKNRYSYLGIPMRAGGQVLGILSLIGEKEHQFNAEEVALLASVADQVGVAVDNTRLRRQAEHAAVIEERERLARELHDSVTQSLYSLSLFAEAGKELVETGDTKAASHNLTRMGETAQQALKEMRLLVYELRPLDLQREGLIGALHQRLSAVEGRVNIKARLVAEELIELPAAVEEGLYRIAQEALNNALKHAAATTVTVYLRIEDNQIEMEIVDDGQGFDPKQTSDTGGMGLTNMQERAKKLGGTLTIDSNSQGTSVKVVAPMHAQ